MCCGDSNGSSTFKRNEAHDKWWKNLSFIYQGLLMYASSGGVTFDLV